MPVTGLFFLPNTLPESNPAQLLINRLNACYETIPLGPWTLTGRLFRETPLPAQSSQSSSNLDIPEKSKPAGYRALQILSLSHHAPRTYVAIGTVHASSQTRVGTPASSQQGSEAMTSGEPATVISIPAGSATDEFTQLMVSKFGPLWQPRQILLVTNGITYGVANFTIRVGELKQGYGGGSQIMTRGAVCEIEWSAVDTMHDTDEKRNEEAVWQSAGPIIRGFWDALEVKGAREVQMVPGVADGDGSVRQWCEILRLRSQQ